MRETEYANEKSEKSDVMKSMQIKEPTMQSEGLMKQENKMNVVSRGSLIVVSERQFETVRTEQLESMRLLNSSANVLLSAMKSVVPPEESGRMIGEYSGQNMRAMAKSICDLLMVKSHVVKQMYSVARDEF